MKLPKLVKRKGGYSHTSSNGIEVYRADFYLPSEVDAYIEAAKKLKKRLKKWKKKLKSLPYAQP